MTARYYPEVGKIAGSINNMFDFENEDDALARRLILDPQTGAVVSSPDLGGNDNNQGGNGNDNGNGNGQ